MLDGQGADEILGGYHSTFPYLKIGLSHKGCSQIGIWLPTYVCWIKPYACFPYVLFYRISLCFCKIGLPVFTDKVFWIFLFVCFVTAVIFFQLFTTLPLYHREQYGLTEFQTGLLMTLNGLIIFFLEMPIVSIFERKQIRKLQIILWGSLMMSMSFFVLLYNTYASILIVSILFITFGEMFIFPFSNSFALSRAPKGHEGRYMALFTMSFSLAHIASSKTGMEIISHVGYQVNWLFMALLGLLSVSCCIWLMNLVRKEQML
jgi:predicted MFS family arabinose efflux permease